MCERERTGALEKPGQPGTARHPYVLPVINLPARYRIRERRRLSPQLPPSFEKHHLLPVTNEGLRSREAGEAASHNGDRDTPSARCCAACVHKVLSAPDPVPPVGGEKEPYLGVESQGGCPAEYIEFRLFDAVEDLGI